ncbi:unnamed protein product [Arctogadus glacialis]
MDPSPDPTSGLGVSFDTESDRYIEPLGPRGDDGYEEEGGTSSASTLSDATPPRSDATPPRSDSSSPDLTSPASLSYYLWDRKDRRTRSLRNFGGLTLFSKR